MKKLIRNLSIKYFKWKNVIYTSEQFQERFNEFAGELNRFSGGICLDYMRVKKIPIEDIKDETSNNLELLRLLTHEIPEKMKKILLKQDVVCRYVRILDVKPRTVEGGSKLAWSFLINLFDTPVVYHTFIDLNELDRLRKKIRTKE